MSTLNSKRLVIGLTIFLCNVAALSGCSGTGGATVPFAELTAGDGVGPAANFNGPAAITTDGTNLYIADSNNDTIRKVVIASGMVTTVAGSKGVSGATDGTGFAAFFNTPFGIANDGINLYVADTGNSFIRKTVIATGVVKTLVGTSGNLNYPEGIATDGTSLFVANTKGNTILQIVIATGTVTTLAGTAHVSGNGDGAGSAALFNAPEGVATDKTYLYVADTDNDTIRKIAIASGMVMTLAGTPGTSGAIDGTGAAANFNSPSGVATDGVNLYVVDTGNNAIRQIVIASGVVTTLAGATGVNGSKDGTGAAAQFNSPSGIATDGTNLYVADTGNNTIRKIVIASSVVTTLAGTAPPAAATTPAGTAP